MSNTSSRQRDFIKICSGCKTICCYGARPPLSRERIRIIEKHLQNSSRTLELREEEYCSPRERADGSCSLFDTDLGQCLVHPVKPETCVAGPITFDINQRTGKIEWYLKTNETCPLAGVMAKEETLLNEHLSSARTELLRLVGQLEGPALKAILRIEEENTIKIGEEILPQAIRLKLKRPSPSGRRANR